MVGSVTDPAARTIGVAAALFEPFDIVVLGIGIYWARLGIGNFRSFS